MSTHWHEKESESDSIYSTYKRNNNSMNEYLMDVQNIRKSLYGALTNSRPQTDVEKMFVKSMCGYLGVLADMEMLLLGQKFELMDAETLSMNLEMAGQRIKSMFEMPSVETDVELPKEEEGGGAMYGNGASMQFTAVKMSDKDLADALNLITKYLGKKGE